MNFCIFGLCLPYFLNFLSCSCTQEWKTCAVGCKFEFSPNGKLDAAFGLPQPSGTASVIRSMESAQYYSENNIDQARRWVSTIWNDLMHFQTFTTVNLYKDDSCGTYFIPEQN